FAEPDPQPTSVSVEDPFPGHSIQELLTQAFRHIGRTVEFDPQGRLTLDGRMTGNFIGKKGNRDYLATTSGKEPYKGNKVTSVASVLGCNPAEAVKWIRHTFNVPVLLPKIEVLDSAFEPIVTSMDETMAYLHKLDPAKV